MMEPLLPIITCGVGLVIGGAAVWVYLKGRISSATSAIKAELEPQLATLTERLGAKEAQITALSENARKAEAEIRDAAARLQAEVATRASAEEKSSRIPGLESELNCAQTACAQQREQNATLAAELKSLGEKLANERQQLDSLKQKFQKEFEAVANRLLVENAMRFGQQSSESLNTLLTPLKDELKDFKGKLETTRSETATHSALLKDQISRIGTEAANLSKALRGDVKVLGNWGENMLDQILEKSGLQLGTHYRRQSSAKDEEGDQRYLDVIVNLPERRHLIIDSKVSLKRYEDHVNCPDEAQRLLLLAEHVECVRSHFRGLGAKRYHEIHGINTPDFVLMYIPIEAAFFSAVAHEPALFSEALDKSVVLITNSTLLATLRTVDHVWRLADQKKNALEIADRGGKLYDKFVGFVADLEKVGESLKASRDAWEEAKKKLHSGAGNLIRQAEQLKELGAKASKSMPPQIAAAATEDELLAIQPPKEDVIGSS